MNRIFSVLATSLLTAGLASTAAAATIEVDVLGNNPSSSICTLRSALEADRLDCAADGCLANERAADTIRFGTTRRGEPK